MPIRLKYTGSRPEGRTPEKGEIWSERGYTGPDRAVYVGRYNADYRANGAGRRDPLVLRMPNGADLVLDFQPGLKLKDADHPEQLTVEGQINLPGWNFSGYIVDGVIYTTHEYETLQAKHTNEQPVAVEADVKREG